MNLSGMVRDRYQTRAAGCRGRARGGNSRRCTGRQISGNLGEAAHVSGVAALLLATKPKLTPAQVRGNLVRSAHRVPGTRNEVGAGVVDALAVVNPGAKITGVRFQDSRPNRVTANHVD